MALKIVLGLLSLSVPTLVEGSNWYASTPISQLKAKGQSTEKLSKRDANPETLYPAHNISVPIDHFQNESLYEPHTNGTFNLRYWFDASYYAPGGPVIVLESGEDTGDDRLPYLQKGLLHQLAQATNGIGVVLEHRYYGQSFPTPDLSTKNLRFLTTDQALADTAYFAQNVVFPGLEDQNLTAPNVPYIAYGGSYAGAFVAFLRVLYPDVYFGAIGSSGVVEAIWDYWQYFQPIIDYGPSECISNTQRLINVVDNILIGRNDTRLTNQLKRAFGLQNVTYNDDFANVLSSYVGAWQGRNWDPAVDASESFYEYCGNVSASTLQFNATAKQTRNVQWLLKAGGYGNETDSLTTPMLNLINYININDVQPCAAEGQTQDSCFGTHNATFYAQDDITQSWRSWPYQYCTQWGFLQTGSGFPSTELPLVSRTLTLEYESIICQDAFNITTPPDTDAINKYGGFNISYDRLALIDGEQDPWRPATAHSPAANNRTSTTDEPYIQIAGAVHHWDENGLFPNETTATLPPAPVAAAQSAEVSFVKQWLTEWKAPTRR
ncbi:peptidase S28 [Viridothelium virens]|uniref:Peptidase S28 n=1 Tax=Viridothelium virens TaxID=1048519 RepID=A0A6A6H375_VIRVR|nr:peptidase S28 [Viridothelium virens]